MTPFLQLALALAVIISVAKVGGYLSFRLGQPTVLGELLIGLLLGPSAFNLLGLPYFSDSHLGETLHHLAEFGVLLLMFLAGLELHLSDLLRSGKVAALAGSLGVALPLALGAGLGLLFGMPLSAAIFLGLILSATSVSISAQTLMELKVLRSRVGIGLLGAAVFDDILVLLGLAIFAALAQPDSSANIGSILLIVVKIGLFLGLASLFGWWAFPRLNRRIGNLPISQGVVAFAFVMMLVYGWFAETIGQMAAITGAFVAGLWFGRTVEKERIYKGLSTIAYAVFVPVFFINIGLSANLREMGGQSGLLLLLVMVLVAVAGKLLGSGAGALWGGLTRRESLQLGAGMISRGEVGLIVASIGVQSGWIAGDIFSAVVGMVIFTTLLTPVLLRWLFTNTAAAAPLKAPPLPADAQPQAAASLANEQPLAAPQPEANPPAAQSESEGVSK